MTAVLVVDPNPCTHGWGRCRCVCGSTSVGPGMRYHEVLPPAMLSAVLRSRTQLPDLETLADLAGVDVDEAWKSLLFLARAVGTAQTLHGLAWPKVHRRTVNPDQHLPEEVIRADLEPLENLRGSCIIGPMDEPPRVIVSSDGEGYFRVEDRGSEDFAESDDPDPRNLSLEGLSLEGAVDRVIAILGRYPLRPPRTS